jgi:excisionase family DNA binding protein
MSGGRDSELLTAAEAAKMLRVSRDAVLRWIRLGQLPAVKLPSGSYRIHRDLVEKMLREGRE